MKISIIIPCYNEELVIDKLYSRMKEVMISISNKRSCELIFIDDGSKDKTLFYLDSYAKEDSTVKIFSFSRNFGHQAAVSAGIHNATGDIAVIIDADLQDPPEIIPDMIKMYEETKIPIIYGKRKSREGESIFKKLTAKIFYRMINALSETSFPVDTGDFRLINKNVIDNYCKFSENPKYIRGLISWMGFKQAPFEYERKARAAGETKYTLKKMTRLALTGILSFSTKPLRFALLLGALAITTALILAIRVLYLYFFNPSILVTGWSSIIITVLFMGGMQLFVLAIISEYLANIFHEIKKRPEYIVEKTIKKE